MKKTIQLIKEVFDIKNNPRNRIILVVLLLAVIVFTLLLNFSYRSFYNHEEYLNKMAVSQRVINETESLLYTLLRVESPGVAYTLRIAKDTLVYQAVNAHLDTLNALLLDDPYQTSNVNALSQQVANQWDTYKKNLSDTKPTANADYLAQIKATTQQIKELEVLKIENYRRQAVGQHKGLFYLNLVSVAIAMLFGLVSLFIFFRDRKERIKVESNLTELNLNKDKFFSIISHDLRGPTANIVRLSEFLLEPNLSEADQKMMTLHLHKAAQNLQKLLENLLSWAKFQMGRLDFMPAPVDLYNLTNESIAQVATMAADKAILIKNQVSPRTYAFADDQMIMMVLRNLLVNAIKFTNQSGSVKVTASETPEEVAISVSDTGIGMSSETTTKLFQLGNHFTTLGTSNEKGSGLGLILCMELLEKNDGTIKVSSEPGKGSIFTFTLPKLSK